MTSWPLYRAFQAGCYAASLLLAFFGCGVGVEAFKHRDSDMLGIAALFLVASLIWCCMHLFYKPARRRTR